MPRAKRAVEDEAQDTALDESQEQEQLRSGQVGEDDFIQTLARKAGWVSKEEWQRDPAKHVDAKAYLERLPEELESVKDRLKRTAQAAEAAMEDERKRARAEALAELREAAKRDDPEAVRVAEQKLEQATPHPETVAWINRNAWFNEDRHARAMAVEEVNALAAKGYTIQEQLAAAEKLIREKFPEHFGEPKREVRMSEARPAPSVQSGSRGPSTQPKEKGFADIPAGDRALYQKHFARRYEGRMTVDEAREKYAKSYWANKGAE